MRAFSEFGGFGFFFSVADFLLIIQEMQRKDMRLCIYGKNKVEV